MQWASSMAKRLIFNPFKNERNARIVSLQALHRAALSGSAAGGFYFCDIFVVQRTVDIFSSNAICFRLSTWFFIRDMSGETTKFNPLKSRTVLVAKDFRTVASRTSVSFLSGHRVWYPAGAAWIRIAKVPLSISLSITAVLLLSLLQVLPFF